MRIGEKVGKAFKKSKKTLVVALVIWGFLALFLMPAVTVSIVEATIDGKFIFGEFITNFLSKYSSFGTNLTKIFLPGYIECFRKNITFRCNFSCIRCDSRNNEGGAF